LILIEQYIFLLSIIKIYRVEVTTEKSENFSRCLGATEVKECGTSMGKCGVKERSDWEEFVKRDCDAIRRGGGGWLAEC
jgi:hypothetical protein